MHLEISRGGFRETLPWKRLDCWCGARSDSWVTGRAGDGTRMDLWHCEGCQTMRASPYLSESAISELYTDYHKDIPDEFDSEYARTDRQIQIIPSCRRSF